MSASVLFDPGFPHGTPDGYRNGCTGSQCAATLSCRDMYRRYVGDYSFARQFDQGVPVVEILARETVERAAYVPPKPKPKRKRVDGRAAANRAKAKPLIPRAEFEKHLADGLTDREIAEKYGLKRAQVAHSRNNAGLPCNPDTKGPRRGLIDDRLHEVAHLSNEEAARVLNRSVYYVHRRRQVVAKKARETG